jgi:hypothetical protein
VLDVHEPLKVSCAFATVMVSVWLALLSPLELALIVGEPALVSP